MLKMADSLNIMLCCRVEQSIIKFLTTINIFLFLMAVFYYGRWGLPIPFRQELQMVMGKAIKVNQNPEREPTTEEIMELRLKFKEALADLYYRNRPEWEKRDIAFLED